MTSVKQNKNAIKYVQTILGAIRVCETIELILKYVYVQLQSFELYVDNQRATSFLKMNSEQRNETVNYYAILTKGKPKIPPNTVQLALQVTCCCHA